MEKPPNYRMVKNYVLARGLVALTECTRKTDTTAVILTKDNVIWGVVYKGIGELRRTNGNTKVKQIETTGSSYQVIRDLGD